MDIDREMQVRHAIKYCFENFDCQTATNRVVEFWKDELKLKEQQCNIANISVSLLERAAILLGKPATNISAILACEKWQKDYERLRNECYIEIGDLNNDGFPDIVQSNSGTSNL